MLLPPSIAPIATGRSNSCRAGFAPAKEERLSTAHDRLCVTDADSLFVPNSLIETGCNNMQAQLYSFPLTSQPSQLAFQGLSAQEGGI